MLRSSSSTELPDCFYNSSSSSSNNNNDDDNKNKNSNNNKKPKMLIIKPSSPTPKHTLYLSNLDDQKFLRFSIKYIYLFKNSVHMISAEELRVSLSRVLVEYYPLAGRLRSAVNSKENDDDHNKLEVDCNGEGAIFAEAFMDITADEFTQVFHNNPNPSWRKLLYKVDASSFLDIPPLVIQVTNLRCGAVILCTAINHCICDGIGTSEFLHAWAHFTRNPSSTTTTTHLPISPFHFRHVLLPRNPPHVTFPNPTFTGTSPFSISQNTLNLFHYLQQHHPLLPASFTFTAGDILRLKRQCIPSLKCTAFEALASHTWRSWIKSFDLLPASAPVKLLFSVNVRKRLNPHLPEGYYGNAFVLACAVGTVSDVADDNLYFGVKSVQRAKSEQTDELVRSTIDNLEIDKKLRTDLSCSLVISQWSKLGLEDLDFGTGKPLLMGSLTSDIYCLFLPVIGDRDAVRVMVSMPENIVGKFKFYMTEFLDDGREQN